jgi:hypothetical protein
MDHAMVETAEKSQVLEFRLAAVDPVSYMVRMAAFRSTRTPRETAPTVPVDQGPPHSVGNDAGEPADIQRL